MMVKPGPDELLPVLVADLADDASRALLEAVASAGGEVCVPLVTAPVDASTHVLEVHTPGFAEPLLLLAEPLGAPVDGPDAGFLLRLTTFEPVSQARRIDPTTLDDPDALRPRVPTSHNLTKRHAAALSPSTRPQAPEELVGRLLANGKLHIDGLIGTGGMGVVYRATHRALRMPIAVKVLHAQFQRDLEFCRRFQAEALAASRLDHPNLTRVLDFGQEADGLVYLAMEFLNGIDVRTVLQRERTIALDRIVEIMSQVCAGLSHVHGRGMVHRDMKPDNVVLVPGHDDEGQPIEMVKLCDFGIAVARGALPQEVVGTPEYMSPEQCIGDELDARSDVYACGVMLYEMVTGKTPFEDPSPIAIVRHHIGSAPRLPSHLVAVDPRLEAIILKALKKDRSERHQSARELRQSLRALTAAPLSTRTPTSPGSFRAARPSTAPDWLEDNNSGQFTAPVSIRVPAQIVEQLAREPGKWLSELEKTKETQKFATMCKELEATIPVLATRREVASLWRISSILAVIVQEVAGGGGPRLVAADRVLKVLHDPAVLAPAAEDLLHGPEATRESRGLLLAAGVAGAYALYGARVKSLAEPTVRKRFTEMLREIGAHAWPVLRAALERLEDQAASAPELAEELLSAIPDARNDAVGEVVARYLRNPHPTVRAAATRALVRTWGDRAGALFVGLLQDGHELVRIAAIGALQDIKAMDEHVVKRLSLMLQQRVSSKLRIEAAKGLCHAEKDARSLAATVLIQLVAGAQVAGIEEDVLLAMARSLLVLAGRGGEPAVKECAAKLREPQKGRLLALIGTV